MKSRIFLLISFAYIGSVWLAIEAMNAQWSFVLPDRGPEFGGGGKMRGAMGEFQDVLILFGTWVYPACVVAAVPLIRRSFATSNRTRKCLLLAEVLLPLGVLARFLWLGVFSAGAGVFG